MNWRAWGKAWLVALAGILLTEAILAGLLAQAGISPKTDAQYLALTVLGCVAALPWLVAQSFLWDRFDRRSQ